MQTIQNILADVQIGEATTFRNLTVFPLFGKESRAADYLTLDEALAQGLASVTEVSEGGSVPELKFVNDSDRPIFLLDSEELQGAKQNRILNLSILAPARKTLKVPVSCVEAGRWAHSSREFSTARHAHFAEGRARKMAQVTRSMRAGGGHHSDQMDVWNTITAKSARMHAPSPTAAAAVMYSAHEDRLEEFVVACALESPSPDASAGDYGEFTAAENQTGAAFAINGKVLGVELFDSAETLHKLLPKLVRSYALDAIDAEGEATHSPAVAEVEAFLKSLGQATATTATGVGLGQDVRLTEESLTGGALLDGDRLIHLSAFAVSNNEVQDTENVFGFWGADVLDVEGSEEGSEEVAEEVVAEVRAA
jgi:hypothetical protein